VVGLLIFSGNGAAVKMCYEARNAGIIARLPGYSIQSSDKRRSHPIILEMLETFAERGRIGISIAAIMRRLLLYVFMKKFLKAKTSGKNL